MKIMSNKCGRCGKSVYQAEERSGAGKKWHKIGCFTCNDCHKSLEQGNEKEHEGEIYCRGCYGKNYGPKGYGYGGGAGALTDTGK